MAENRCQERLSSNHLNGCKEIHCSSIHIAPCICSQPARSIRCNCLAPLQMLKLSKPKERPAGSAGSVWRPHSSKELHKKHLTASFHLFRKRRNKGTGKIARTVLWKLVCSSAANPQFSAPKRNGR